MKNTYWKEYDHYKYRKFDVFQIGFEREKKSRYNIVIKVIGTSVIRALQASIAKGQLGSFEIDRVGQVNIRYILHRVFSISFLIQLKYFQIIYCFPQ